MQIRRRYPKTKMASHRRRFLPAWVRYTQYKAFIDRQKWGRYPSIYYWHKKNSVLTELTLLDALKRIHPLRNVR